MLAETLAMGYTTGGASSRAGHGPLDAAFTLAEMQALVAESHGQGRRVMCHALGGPGLRTAIEAGADSIEHGCYLDEDPELLNLADPARIELVFKGGVICADRRRPPPTVS